MSKRLTVKEYARRHRLSIFQVVKKINSGELPSETVRENGREVRYILLEKGTDPAETKEATNDPAPPDDISLARELAGLRREIRELRLLVERCCGRDFKPLTHSEEISAGH